MCPTRFCLPTMPRMTSLEGNEATGTAFSMASAWSRRSNGTAFYREERGRPTEEGVPSTQMLRYPRRVRRRHRGPPAMGHSHQRPRLAALLARRAFRRRGLSPDRPGKALRLPGCELDLLDKRPSLFGDDDEWRAHAFKLFVAMFSPEAFLPAEGGQTFHDFARARGKFWEAPMAKTFRTSRSIGSSGGSLTRFQRRTRCALRRLLLDENSAGNRGAQGRWPSVSASFVTYWPKIASIFQAIAKGDDDFGIPPTTAASSRARRQR